jgi:PAS domain S-box-containing protein
MEELTNRGGVLDKLMDAVFDAAVLVDRQGRIIHASKGTAELAGQTQEALRSQPISVLHPDTKYEHIIRNGKAEIELVKSVTGRKCIVNVVPITWKGEVIAVLGIVVFRGLGQLKAVLASLVEQSKKEYDPDQTYDALARLDSSYTFDDFIGETPVVKKLLAQCRRAALSPYPVLITGETGTGKEILASAIHSEYRRNSFAPFIKINCTAIPHDLLESELFGHEKGAFTGAVAAKKGKFELASGGSILLDEIGDMDLGLQGKLLRAIEEKEFERVGGTKLLPLNARILASTNRSLKELCRQGRFRWDLYYRLSIIEIKVPPLRARKEDIPLLTRHLAEKHGAEISFSPGALRALMEYDWPGNVRELRNVVLRLSLVGERKVVTAEEVKAVLGEDQGPTGPGIIGQDPVRGEKEAPPGTDSVAAEEKEAILRALELCHFNVAAAARRLGVCRATLYSRIRKYNIVLQRTYLPRMYT